MPTAWLKAKILGRASAPRCEAGGLRWSMLSPWSQPPFPCVWLQVRKTRLGKRVSSVKYILGIASLFLTPFTRENFPTDFGGLAPHHLYLDQISCILTFYFSPIPFIFKDILFSFIIRTRKQGIKKGVTLLHVYNHATVWCKFKKHCRYLFLRMQ